MVGVKLELGILDDSGCLFGAPPSIEDPFDGGEVSNCDRTASLKYDTQTIFSRIELRSWQNVKFIHNFYWTLVGTLYTISMPTFLLDCARDRVQFLSPNSQSIKCKNSYKNKIRYVKPRNDWSECNLLCRKDWSLVTSLQWLKQVKRLHVGKTRKQGLRCKMDNIKSMERIKKQPPYLENG